MLTPQNIQFLKELSNNNHREWFENHKSVFLKFQLEFKQFHAEVRSCLLDHDQIESDKVHRIYRDIRFTRDKTPYKTSWSGSFRRATAYRRGGYYYQVGPEGSFVAGGFFGPNSQDLLHLRKQISQDPDPLVEALASEDFQKHFGGLKGDRLKTTPKGFSADDPSIDLLRHKQFLVYKHFDDTEVTAPGFARKINESFKAMRPFFDIMSLYLTTDLNGESIV